jgi:hypothetical protein
MALAIETVHHEQELKFEANPIIYIFLIPLMREDLGKKVNYGISPQAIAVRSWVDR